MRCPVLSSQPSPPARLGPQARRPQQADPPGRRLIPRRAPLEAARSQQGRQQKAWAKHRPSRLPAQADWFSLLPCPALATCLTGSSFRFGGLGAPGQCGGQPRRHLHCFLDPRFRSPSPLDGALSPAFSPPRPHQSSSACRSSVLLPRRPCAACVRSARRPSRVPTRTCSSATQAALPCSRASICLPTL